MATDILELARKIRRTGKEIKRTRDRNASSLGITSNQTDALFFIDDHPECSVKDLTVVMGVSHQAACGIADRLGEKGLVVFGTNDDARVKTLSLSDSGEDIVSKLYEMGEERNSELFRALTEQERQTLGDLLDRILRDLDGRCWHLRDSI